MSHVHVIGAGLAGLSAAVRLIEAGHTVSIYEAAPHAGGRCRSYYDNKLERTVDNGNHILLSANTETLDFLAIVGGRNRVSSPPGAYFPFVDLASGERWTMRPNAGPIPWWIFAAGRRVAGTKPQHYLRALRLLAAKPDSSVADALYSPHDPLWERLWKPLTVSILNTEPEHASAALFRRTLLITLAKGGAKSTPMTATVSLSHTFVEPSLAYLDAADSPIQFGQRLRRLDGTRRGVTTLDFGKEQVPVQAGEMVVLAVTAPVAAQLLPRLSVPTETRPIVNAHIRLPHRARLAEGIPYLGMLGGTAEWLFLRQDVASVTVSAANDLVDYGAEDIARIIWRDVARALTLDPRLRPATRVVKERRATIAQRPSDLARRPKPGTPVPNLILAGAWTNTGLPSTIEGAVTSGRTAARLVEKRLDRRR
jgi:squalene-associated FAD-dependent desaturase